MFSRPWVMPELTSVGRLPMHSVPHTDRVVLDGRWRFQLLHTPEEKLAADWSEADVPGCWTMSGSADPLRGFFDLPHYTNVQMPFPGDPPDLPDVNPTGVYEREFDLPAAWSSDRRVVLHVGAAESVLIVTLNGNDVGISKDSHLAAEFDVTGIVRPGSNTISFRVVKCTQRRGFIWPRFASTPDWATTSEPGPSSCWPTLPSMEWRLRPAGL